MTEQEKLVKMSNSNDPDVQKLYWNIQRANYLRFLVLITIILLPYPPEKFPIFYLQLGLAIALVAEPLMMKFLKKTKMRV